MLVAAQGQVHAISYQPEQNQTTVVQAPVLVVQALVPVVPQTGSQVSVGHVYATLPREPGV